MVATKCALASSSLALPLLAVPVDFVVRNRLVVVTAHLALLVLSAAVLAMKLEPLSHRPMVR